MSEAGSHSAGASATRSVPVAASSQSVELAKAVGVVAATGTVTVNDNGDAVSASPASQQRSADTAANPLSSSPSQPSRNIPSSNESGPPESISKATTRWLKVRSDGTPPTPAKGMKMALVGKYFWIFGGTTSETASNDTFRVSVEAIPPPSPRRVQHTLAERTAAGGIGSGPSSGTPISKSRNHQLAVHPSATGGTSAPAYALSFMPIVCDGSKPLARHGHSFLLLPANSSPFTLAAEPNSEQEGNFQFPPLKLSCSYANKILLIGGVHHSNGQVAKRFLSDCFILDTSTPIACWYRVSIAGDFIRRAYHSTTLCQFDGKAYVVVIGGENENGSLSDIQILNLSSWTWTRKQFEPTISVIPTVGGASRPNSGRVASESTFARSHHCTVLDRLGFLFVFGGRCKDGSASNDLIRIELRSLIQSGPVVAHIIPAAGDVPTPRFASHMIILPDTQALAQQGATATLPSASSSSSASFSPFSSFSSSPADISNSAQKARAGAELKLNDIKLDSTEEKSSTDIETDRSAFAQFLYICGGLSTSSSSPSSSSSSSLSPAPSASSSSAAVCALIDVYRIALNNGVTAVRENRAHFGARWERLSADGTWPQPRGAAIFTLLPFESDSNARVLLFSGAADDNAKVSASDCAVLEIDSIGDLHSLNLPPLLSPPALFKTGSNTSSTTSSASKVGKGVADSPKKRSRRTDDEKSDEAKPLSKKHSHGNIANVNGAATNTNVNASGANGDSSPQTAAGAEQTHGNGSGNGHGVSAAAASGGVSATATGAAHGAKHNEKEKTKSTAKPQNSDKSKDLQSGSQPSPAAGSSAAVKGNSAKLTPKSCCEIL